MKVANVELIDIQTKLNEELKTITAKLQTVKSKTNDINKLDHSKGKQLPRLRPIFNRYMLNPWMS